MATQFVQEQPRAGADYDTKMVEAAGAGSAAVAIGGAAAIVLSIIGLAGALSTAMMAISTIVLGAALLLDAAAVGARYDRLVRDAWGANAHLHRVEVGGGISAGALGGIAGIALGILALLGLVPLTLCCIALIVFGGALLLGSAAKARFGSLSTAHYGVGESVRRVVDEALNVSAGGEVLIGIGAVVLGILALLGLQPLTLVLVGFLGVGFALMMSGSALGARMFGLMRHRHVH